MKYFDACVRACVRACMRACAIALSRRCLTATVGTVSLMPLSRRSGLCSSIDFGHTISASLDLAGFEDACRLCRRQLGVLLEGLVGFAWSIAVCYPTSFLLAAPFSLVLHPQVRCNVVSMRTHLSCFSTWFLERCDALVRGAVGWEFSYVLTLLRSRVAACARIYSHSAIGPSVRRPLRASAPPSIGPSFCQPLRLSAPPSIGPSVCRPLDPSVGPSIRPSAPRSVRRPLRPSAGPSVRRPLDPSVGPSISPSAPPSFRPYIHICPSLQSLPFASIFIHYWPLHLQPRPLVVPSAITGDLSVQLSL